MKNLLEWFFRLLGKISTERRYQVSLGVSTAGLTLIISSHLLDGYTKFHLMATILLEIGIACIIAAIAEFLLLKHASDVFREEVQEDMKKLDHAVATFQQEVRQDLRTLEHADEIFRHEVRKDMKILSHCQEHELTDVMPPRNKDQKRLAIEEISLAIQNARDEICIIAFTLGDILNEPMSLNGPLQELLKRDEKVAVKLLLIDPTSAAAHIRVMADEDPETVFGESRLLIALRANFFQVKGMMKDAENKNEFTMEVRFYNILPNFYMVSTPDEVFIQPYHLGGHSGEGSDIGRVVPLLRFSSRSPMYKFAQSHFSYIWHSQKKNSSGNGTSHNNEYIWITNMDDVNRKREIERRFDRPERRNRATQIPTERRSLERRLTTKVKAKRATV